MQKEEDGIKYDKIVIRNVVADAKKQIQKIAKNKQTTVSELLRSSLRRLIEETPDYLK